ncbi:OB-fold nucleic acid binding domain-containing protein [Thiorhodovibrio winogradskyi]|nr:OB-fold nucleic acid binding domain-containing protein [Thiorhodovibrio winogradskyi]
MTSEYLRPKLLGGRFDHHRLPLEVLKDFSALEEMIVAVAKWQYLQTHQDRERVPRGFSGSIQLALTAIEEGSTIPVIALSMSPGSHASNLQYFERARDLIINTMFAMQQQSPCAIPTKLLSYFDRFGRSLKEEECIEFTASNGQTVVYNQQIRHDLIRASQIESWSEDAVLRGRIAEVEAGRSCFELELRDGTRISGPIPLQHQEVAFKGLLEYQVGTAVAVQGVVKKDRHDRILKIESIEDLTILDPLDVVFRLEELSALKPGWLDGRWTAVSSQGLHWLAGAFEHYYDTDLPLPYLYPTAEGEIRAEWSFDHHEVSLDVDLETKRGLFHALDLVAETDKAFQAALDSEDGWSLLNQALRSLEPALK